jgi:hypothetical protein
MRALTEHLDRAISGQFEGEVRIGQDERQQWVEGGPPRLHSQGPLCAESGYRQIIPPGLRVVFGRSEAERLIS